MTDEPKEIVCNGPPLPAELCCTSHDKDALHAAVYENDAATFDYLVNHNVDLNCRNSFGETPLLMGIRRMGSLALIERLLDLGCDINITDESDRTPLHVATLNGNVEIAQKLIELGADLDVQDLHTRETPLFYAIKNSDIEAVCMLLCYGADVTIKNASNFTPLTHAMGTFRGQDIVLILLDYCDDFNYRNNYGYTPLIMVIGYGSDLVTRLIDAGADVNVVTNGYSVLDYAMSLAVADVFKKIWGRINVDVVPKTKLPLLLTYIQCELQQYSTNEWVECLYLMLESPIAIDLMDRCMVYCASSPHYIGSGFITELLYCLQKQNVTWRDRQNIINICVTLGAEVTVTDLDAAIQLFGFNEEFNTLVYATEHYRSNRICHPLLRLIIGLNDFNFLHMIRWYRNYINYRPSREGELEELVNNIIVNCVRFFSLTPFWKENLRQVYRHYRHHKLVEKIKAAREFPSLLELSRNRVHSLVREMRKAQKPYQFHDALKRLPLPVAIVDLLLFKRPIYG